VVNVSTLTTNKGFQAFVFLQALDVMTTLTGFSCGLGEANPVISRFFPALGLLSGLLVGKLLMVLVIVGFMTLRSSVNTEKGWRFVNTLFSLLVIWNSTLILLRLFHVA
jgi:hypothetical protein